MPLTSPIKELDAINTFGIKLNKYEPGLIQTNEHDKHLKLVGVDGDADALGPGVFGGGLCAAKARNEKWRNFDLSIWKPKKESRF